jgi:cell division protein ZipA
VIKGEDLESVAGTHGFEFGEMDIFHYHGEDNRGKTDSLFSLVNMYEPGYFAPDAMEGFSTRGVSIFASLPVDGTGEPVFRKMLDVTARMAEEMDCVVWGPDKQPLTVDAIKNIYQQISREQSSQA